MHLIFDPEMLLLYTQFREIIAKLHTRMSIELCTTI